MVLLRLYKKLIFSTFNQHYARFSDDRAEFKRVLITIQVIIIAIFSAIFFALVDTIFGLYVNAIMDLSVAVIFWVALILINSGSYSYGKLLVVFYANTVTVINSLMQGVTSGGYLLFFPIMSGIFILYSVRREKKYLLISVIFTLISIIALEIMSTMVFESNKNISKEYEKINYLVCLSISLLMVSLFSYSYVSIYQSTEIKLRRLNIKLKRQNMQLYKTNSELDSFVYKASHDLRAPLTSMLGLIEIMRLENDIEKNRQYTDLQIKLVKKLDSYIQDILNISKNARLPLDLCPINFEELIQDTLKQLQYTENYWQINKHIDVQQNSPFYSDEKRLNIIFNNLISNALRYSDTEKEFPNISITVETTESQAHIEIRDNGIGIRREHLPKVFDMFYRATAVRSGSGLGLYIVKETVERLGGAMRIHSEFGNWTKFNRLPAKIN